MKAAGSSVIRFGVFEANLMSGELRKNGRPIKLQPQPFKLLAFLLERPGELVTREEIRPALWGDDTFVDFEPGLNFAVMKIREALGDNAERPRYIETLHRRGYRFIAPVEREGAGPVLEGPVPATPSGSSGRVVSIAHAGGFARQPMPAQAASSGALAADASVEAAILSPPGVRAAPPQLDLAAAKAPIPWRLITAGFLLMAGAAILWVLLTPAATPKVLRSIQLTHSGRAQPHGRVLSDGSRLYFAERTGGTLRLAQIPLGGGDPTRVAVSASAEIFDIDPTGTNLLFGVPSTHIEDPVWVAPAAGGSARRLGDAVAIDAAWSPDRHWVAYGRESGAILVIAADGGPSRQLLRADGLPMCLRWSPDGRMIWFSLKESSTGAISLWKVDARGGIPHRLLQNWASTPAADLLLDAWSPDGRYLVFRSRFSGPSSLWAVRVKKGWFGERLGSPVQLYTSPDQIGPASFSRDGTKLYFVNFQPRRELIRYDESRKQFVPYLSGIPARFLAFSRDGQWVAYRRDTDGTVWRSRTDGTERLELTFPPMDADVPSWSPDGGRIAFAGAVPGGATTLYAVPAGGGRITVIAPDDPTGSDPSWSPDGRSLLFRRWGPSSITHGSEGDLYLLDYSSRRTGRLPGSDSFPDGFKGAQWSPDGHYAAALERNSALLFFDFTTQRWSQIASGTDIYAAGMRWSADSRYVYYQDVQQGEQPVFRVRVSDRKVERIASLRQILSTDLLSYSMTGLTPDGSPVASLLHSASDIYTLEVGLP